VTLFFVVVISANELAGNRSRGSKMTNIAPLPATEIYKHALYMNIKYSNWCNYII